MKTGIKSKLASTDNTVDQKKYESADKILYNEVIILRSIDEVAQRVDVQQA